METWLSIMGYEGLYQISNLGRLMSLKRKGRTCDKILKCCKDGKGYKYAILINAGGKKMFKIHRLVAVAFIPNPESYPQVNHLDGVKENNSVVNLEWVNNQQNCTHAVALGLTKNGVKHRLSKLNPSMVLEARRLNAEGISVRTLAPKYGVTHQVLYSAIKKKTWKFV